MKKHEIRIETITSFCLAGIILFFSVSFFISKKEEFSVKENRYLETFPTFSFQNLKNGSFTKDLESYLADHFSNRDFFMGFKTGFEKSLGKREINDVYLGKNGYFIEKYQTPVQNEKIINTFNGFAEKIENAEVSFMLIPTAISIYQEKLPPFVKDNRQMETFYYLSSEISGMIDVSEALLEKKEEFPLFYKLDHHWTTYGAYLAYQEFAKAKGFSAKEIEEYQVSVVSDDFKGTIYSKVNDYSVAGDEIVIFEMPDQKVEVAYQDSGEVSDSFYEYSYLEKKDQYSFFLNNIHPLIEITSYDAESEEEIVVIKDSYANCFVPFLAEHYKKIYVVDTRYYKDAISEFINQNKKIKDVLVLYNMNTIDSDLGVGGIY